MTACLRCGTETSDLLCPSCEFAARESEGETIARLVPEPGAVACGEDRDEAGHLSFNANGGPIPGLCHCALGEAHYAEASG